MGAKISISRKLSQAPYEVGVENAATVHNAAIHTHPRLTVLCMCNFAVACTWTHSCLGPYIWGQKGRASLAMVTLGLHKLCVWTWGG